MTHSFSLSSRAEWRSGHVADICMTCRRRPARRLLCRRRDGQVLPGSCRLYADRFGTEQSQHSPLLIGKCDVGACSLRVYLTPVPVLTSDARCRRDPDTAFQEFLHQRLSSDEENIIYRPRPDLAPRTADPALRAGHDKVEVRQSVLSDS